MAPSKLLLICGALPALCMAVAPIKQKPAPRYLRRGSHAHTSETEWSPRRRTQPLEVLDYTGDWGAPHGEVPVHQIENDSALGFVLPVTVADEPDSNKDGCTDTLCALKIRLDEKHEQLAQLSRNVSIWNACKRSLKSQEAIVKDYEAQMTNISVDNTTLRESPAARRGLKEMLAAKESEVASLMQSIHQGAHLKDAVIEVMGRRHELTKDLESLTRKNEDMRREIEAVERQLGIPSQNETK